MDILMNTAQNVAAPAAPPKPSDPIKPAPAQPDRGPEPVRTPAPSPTPRPGPGVKPSEPNPGICPIRQQETWRNASLPTGFRNPG